MNNFVDTSEGITKKLALVKEKISISAKKTERNPEEIKLIAVTKNVSVEKIKSAILCGINAIGENRIQEAKSKYPFIEKEAEGVVEWHMVGHLQTNKIKDAVRMFDLIQSIDRINLTEELNKEGKKQNKIVKGLIQVNVSGEETKFGIPVEEIFNLTNAIAKMENLKIYGLMTIAPLLEDSEGTRMYFRTLKELYEKITKMNLRNIEMKWLSMGMSNDFEIAIEEGANMVRIGTVLFGR